jgi:hypothetical protein
MTPVDASSMQESKPSSKAKIVARDHGLDLQGRARRLPKRPSKYLPAGVSPRLAISIRNLSPHVMAVPVGNREEFAQQIAFDSGYMGVPHIEDQYRADRV